MESVHLAQSSGNRSCGFVSGSLVCLALTLGPGIIAAQTPGTTLVLGEPRVLFSSPDVTFIARVFFQDINGDGLADVVFFGWVANNNSQTVAAPFFILNDGSSQPFSTSQARQVEAAATNGILNTGMDLADMNGDGRPDLVVMAGASTTVYFNAGGANPFSTNSAYSFNGIATTLGFAIGDANGDGAQDLVLYQGSGGLCLNNGTARPFEGVTRLDIGMRNLGYANFRFVDVDGDSRQDLLINSAPLFAGVYGGTGVRRNNGAPSFFTDASFISMGVALKRLPVALDVNNDGKPDLVGAEGDGLTGDEWSVYLHTGSPTPYSGRIALVHSPALTSCSAIAEDVNGDGRIDVAFGCGNTVRGLSAGGIVGGIFLNDGSATPFASAVPIDIPRTAAAGSAASLAAAQMNGQRGIIVAGSDVRFYPLVAATVSAPGGGSSAAGSGGGGGSFDLLALLALTGLTGVAAIRRTRQTHPQSR